MGQKSLDSFFKRPASCQGAAKDATAAAASGDDAAQPPAAGAVAGVPPQPPAVAAAAAGDDSAAEAAQDVHAAQASEQQRMRAAANRNAALAKQVRAAGACFASGWGKAGAALLTSAEPLETPCLCNTSSDALAIAANSILTMPHGPQVVIRAEQAGGLPRLGDLLIEPSWREALEWEMDKAYWADLVSLAGCQLELMLCLCWQVKEGAAHGFEAGGLLGRGW